LGAEQNNSATLTVVSALSDYPDLRIGSLALEPSGAWSPSQPVTVSWRVSNSGTGAAEVSRVDRVIIRNLTTGHTVLDQRCASNLPGGVLDAGAFEDRSLSFLWPEGTEGVGRFEIQVVADADQAVFENNAANTAELNNTVMMTAETGPDLLVANLAVQQASLQAGDQVTLAWDVRNDGVSSVPGGFYERIKVRNLDTGELLVNTVSYYDPAVSGAGLIGAGESRSRFFSFRLPDGVRGTGNLEISVVADQGLNGLGSVLKPTPPIPRNPITAP